MDPHPVPQDIINVEFKLFGSFTLKQFLKLVIACAIALGVFFLPLNPLIKFPVVGVILIIGVGIAIVPNFDVWITSYIKAIFVSPRYVWVKSTNTPDVFSNKNVSTGSSTPKVTSSKKNESKINLEEISLEKLLAPRDNPRKSTPSIAPQTNDGEVDARDQNLNRSFNQIFGDDQQPKLATTQAPFAQQNQQQQVIQQTNNQNEVQNQETVIHKTREQYMSEINELKQSLNNLIKDQNYKENESEILHRINDLYQELRMLDYNQKPSPQLNKGEKITNFQGQEVAAGQQVLGIIVDKQNKPVANANLKFMSEANQVIDKTTTNKDGKFSTSDKLPIGTYTIAVEHRKLKFPSYKINIGDKTLPAYKLRAK